MAAYIIGHNMTGYLPESEPYAFSDHASAKQALIDDLLRYADDAAVYGDDEERAEDLDAAAQELNLISKGEEWSTTIGYRSGSMSYWLVFDADADADEYNEEMSG